MTDKDFLFDEHPITWTISDGNVEILDLIIQNFPAEIKAYRKHFDTLNMDYNSYRISILKGIISKDHPDMLKYVLKWWSLPRRWLGNDILYHTASHGTVTCMKILLEYFPEVMMDVDWHLMIFYADHTGNTEMSSYLTSRFLKVPITPAVLNSLTLTCLSKP